MSTQMFVATLGVILFGLIFAAVLSALISIRHGKQFMLQTEAIRALDQRLRGAEILLYDLGYRPQNGIWVKPAQASPFDAIDPGAATPYFGVTPLRGGPHV